QAQPTLHLRLQLPHLDLGQQAARDRGLVAHNDQQEPGPFQPPQRLRRPGRQPDVLHPGQRAVVLDQDAIAIEEHRPRRTGPHLHPALLRTAPSAQVGTSSRTRAMASQETHSSMITSPTTATCSGAKRSSAASTSVCVNPGYSLITL